MTSTLGDLTRYSKSKPRRSVRIGLRFACRSPLVSIVKFDPTRIIGTTRPGCPSPNLERSGQFLAVGSIFQPPLKLAPLTIGRGQVSVARIMEVVRIVMVPWGRALIIDRLILGQPRETTAREGATYRSVSRMASGQGSYLPEARTQHCR